MRALTDVDLDGLVAELVESVLEDPTGALGPSVYETARLVSLASWLDGDAARVRYLLDEQQPDGSWGGPGGYALVPTLSATEALLVVLGREDREGGEWPLSRAALAEAARRGLAAAAALVARSAEEPVPSTVVFFMVIPALVEGINARRAVLGDGPVQPLALPHGLSDEALRGLRGGAWRNPLAGHYLEIVGPAAVGAAEMEPVDGVVGCSAAATAAWLGPREPADPAHPSVRFLRQAQERGAGPVPAMTSIVFYERAWIAGNLATAGVPRDVLAPLLKELPVDVGRSGAPTAPGFAYEAETSAIVLTALACLGAPQEPEYLWQYDAGSHFMSTIPEHEPSTTTNAHILEALGCHLADGPADGGRYRDAVNRIASWLRGRQQPDGSWYDKWHASPFFATMRCALALHRYAGPASAEALDRSVDWLLHRQHEDGSWGRWQGAAEETAYAVRTLLALTSDGNARSEQAAQAVRRGCSYLLGHGLNADRRPPLWIGKELYAPGHLVNAAVLGALIAARG
ncbi:prenyltransferase/squalene oxidase repeat-containing protein [Streptomyces sp. NPDC014006]|uniref:prenyltransferase/squalene oxidase repeat-containing protein n=1 Tax=Streptomyces sp. NPDC014006 TaxID=3364870 RepID=UPI00370092F3